MNSYASLPNKLISAPNGVDYAYRDTGGGEGGVPLVLFQHFRGNLDNWDPALIDALALARRVITVDNAGIGGSTGTTPGTVEQMARDAIAFLAVMDLGQVDLLGFSIGSFVAQQVALTRPAIVRRLVLASAAPQGAAGMHSWAPEVIGAIGTPQTSPGEYLSVFFARSSASQQAGQHALQRMHIRTEDRDTATTWATREAQYDAVCAWGIPDHAKLQRLSAIDMPVFVANGDSDPMILPHYSYLLAGLIPQARVKIYPDSAHGFLFQHHAEFAADVEAFLSDPSLTGPAYAQPTIQEESQCPSTNAQPRKDCSPEDLKAKIAAAITDAHVEATGAPWVIVHVFFNELPPGISYSAGEPDTQDLGDHRIDPRRRTLERKQKLIKQIVASWTEITGQPAKQLIAGLTEIDSEVQMEYGLILPRPGDEPAWFADNAAAPDGIQGTGL